MDFSEMFKCSGPIAYSPDGRYLAIAAEYRLFVRDAETLAVVQLYSCLDKIHTLDWSPNSAYVMCGLYDRGVVQIWSATEQEWTCKIDEGPAGIAHACWAPSGLSVVLVADFGVRITVWSLLDRACSYLPGCKHAGQGMAFTPSGDVMAVLERRECKDWVACYSTCDWQLLQRFLVDTRDAADLAWSPNGAHLAVWDNSLGHKVCVYGPDGQLKGSHSSPGDGLGIKAAVWAPGGDGLAIGSYDQVAYVLNNVTWQPLIECHHGSPVAAPATLVAYQEQEEGGRGVLEPVQAPQSSGGKGTPKREARARYVVAPLPLEVTSVTPAPSKACPKLGVGMVAWSPDSRFLATVNDNMPHAAWVWDLHAGCLAAVLLQGSVVRGLAWAPSGTRLAVVAGGARLYVWAPAGASIVHVPLPGFRAGGVRWSPDGSAMVLNDKECFCCAYCAE